MSAGRGLFSRVNRRRTPHAVCRISQTLTPAIPTARLARGGQRTTAGVGERPDRSRDAARSGCCARRRDCFVILAARWAITSDRDGSKPATLSRTSRARRVSRRLERSSASSRSPCLSRPCAAWTSFSATAGRPRCAVRNKVLGRVPSGARFGRSRRPRRAQGPARPPWAGRPASAWPGEAPLLARGQAGRWVVRGVHVAAPGVDVNTCEPSTYPREVLGQQVSGPRPGSRSPRSDGWSGST